MTRPLQQWLVFLGACGLLSVALNAAEPTTKDVPPGQLSQWVAELNDESYQRREEASRYLVAAGNASIEVLAQGVLSEHAEISWRAGSALESIALDGDEQTLGRVASTLDKLSQSGKPGLKKLAREIRVRQLAFRHDRAVATIRGFGGRLAGGIGYDAGAIALADGPVFGGVVPRIIIAEEEELLGIDIEPTTEPGRPVPAAPDPAAPPAPIPADVAPAITSKEAAGGEVGIHDALAPPPELPEEPAAVAEPAADDLAPPPLPAIGDIADAGLVGEVTFLADTANELSAALTLDANWRGGDEGLLALQHLPEIRSLTLEDAPLSDRALKYVATLPKLNSLHIRGVGFTATGLREFRKQCPRTTIFALGDAMLGINADVRGGPCVLSSVFYNSGAHEAGLKQGDKLLKIDGDTVRDFSDVTIAVYRRQPGEKLRIEYQRGGRSQIAEVTLKARAAPPRSR